MTCHISSSVTEKYFCFSNPASAKICDAWIAPNAFDQQLIMTAAFISALFPSMADTSMHTAEESTLIGSVVWPENILPVAPSNSAFNDNNNGFVC